MSEWEAGEGQHWATNADRYTRMLARFGDVLIEAAAFAVGERVLDVGCGCGDVSLAAGRAVGNSGAVQGVDLSPAMLEVASTRAGAENLDHVGFVAADAARYAVERADYDVTVSRFGVMFFDDPAAAFTHIRSLMVDGGRLAFVCWQDLFANDWMMVPGAAVAEVLPLPIGGDATLPGPFAFADVDRVTSVLTSAGFINPRTIATTAKLWMGDTAADAAGFLRTTGLGRAVLDDAEPDLVEEAMRRAQAALEPYESPTGVELDGSAWLVTASA